MGKSLIIAEKPSVAKDIAIALGGFGRVENWLESETAIVTAAQGHLIEVFTSQMITSGKTLDTLPVIPDHFETRVIDGTNKPQAFETIRKLMFRNDVDQVVNACDAGREGELIFRLIYQHAGCTKPMKRMWFNAMTPEAIRESFQNMRPGSDFDNLSAAAFCRTEGDLLVGVNGSRGVSRLYERQTAKAENRSVGRVQTPTGAIVVDRENEIRGFKPKDFWEIIGHFGVAAGTYEGKWFDPNFKQAEQRSDGNSEQPEDTATRFYDRARADEIVARCTGQAPSKVTEESKGSSKGAPKLYDLTLLEREVNRKHGLSAKRTDEIAQNLYDKYKVTTYPRTDSCYISEKEFEKTRAVIKALAGTPYDAHASRILENNWFKLDKKVFDSSKVTDHGAIIPTGKKPEGLTPEESMVYDMIVRRFLAVFHPAAQYEVTTRITIVAGEHFKSSGRVLAKEGWLAVYGTEVDEEDKKVPSLVKYEQGEPVSNAKIDLKTLKTKPPARFTEDTLLAAMESAGKYVEDEELRDAMKARGLGTPATRSNIIETLLSNKDRNGKPKEPYIRRDGKSLVPTQKLINLIKFLRDNDIELLASPKMTGDWEFKLRLMEQGKFEREVFNQEIATLTRHILDVIRSKAADVVVKKLEAKCPECGGDVSIGARTYTCESNCGFTIWKEVAGRPLKPSEAETLLSTGSVMNLSGFISKSKKKFTACLKLEKGVISFFFDETVDSHDAAGNLVHCPECQQLMRRIKGTKGYFWGCTDRDNCKTTLEDNAGNPVPKAAPQPCPKCGGEMHRISGKTGHFWACSDRESCKHTMNDRDGVPIARAESIPCPACGKPMYRRERRDKKGAFWGCSGYKKEGGGCSCSLQDDDGKPVLSSYKPVAEGTLQ